jgi:predicted secreted Zn-dependent protease
MAVEFSDVEWVGYDVGGDTLADVVANISHLPEAGSAEWFPSFDYQADDSGNVTDATITMGWRITMPTWTGYDAATQSQKDEWDRFWAALETHERGHLELADQHFRALDQEIIGHPASEAQATFNRALSELQSASDSYDSGNDHGRNAGTVVDVDA